MAVQEVALGLLAREELRMGVQAQELNERLVAKEEEQKLAAFDAMQQQVMVMTQELQDAHNFRDSLLAEGRLVQVCLGMPSREKTPLPDALRALLNGDRGMEGALVSDMMYRRALGGAQWLSSAQRRSEGVGAELSVPHLQFSQGSLGACPWWVFWSL